MNDVVGATTISRRCGAAAMTVAVLVTGLLAGCTVDAPDSDAQGGAPSCRPEAGVTHLDVPGPGQRASTGWWPDSHRRCSAVSSSPASLQPGVWYHATAVEGAGAVDAAARSAPISVMVADQGGSPVLIARGPVNGYTVPVTVENGRVEPDRSRPAGVTAAACVDASSPDCIVDGWIGSWATRPFAVVQVDGRLQLVTSGARITIAG